MNFFSFKLSDSKSQDFVERIQNFEKGITISRLNWYQSEIKTGDIVFINLSGDKVDWEKGLVAISKVSKEPFDLAYEANNFRIKVDVLVVLPEPIQRHEFIRYKDLYDVAGLGPTTKGLPNQAIIKVEEEKAIIIIRAILDRFPKMEVEISNFIDNNLIQRAKLPIITLEEQLSDFNVENSLSDTINLGNESIFRDYMLPNYAESTINNYCFSLKKGLKKVSWISEYLVNQLHNQSLFSTSNLKLVSNIEQEYKSHLGYDELNIKDHGTLSAALKLYMTFLKEKELTKITDGENVIFYGAPGSGKSYLIQAKIEESGVESDSIFRTTFYPDYGYSDFVGQIIPSTISGKPIYEFVPGPFTLALKKAFETPGKRIYLVIEELNRGNAPAIFGDIFQLLDRESSDSRFKYKGDSQYSIKNLTITNYLESQGINLSDVIIPSNMFIYASMNSSDQNVFTMDTAFKRRWNFVYVKNSFINHPYKDYLIPGSSVNWERFITIINLKIHEQQGKYMQSEDKQLGTYFVNRNYLQDPKEEITYEKIERFASKVLEYLWNDIVKHDKSTWFSKECLSLESLISLYVEFGKSSNSLKVFSDDFYEELVS